jgi:parallel beta-helix repeat protein
MVLDNVVYNCWSAGIYLDGSTEVTVDRNYVYANDPDDLYSRERRTVRADGVLIMRENGTVPSPNMASRITNNIIDSVGVGIKYAPYGAGDDLNDTFGNLMIAQNTVTWTDPASRDDERPYASTNPRGYGGIIVLSPDRPALGTNYAVNNVLRTSGEAALSILPPNSGTWVVENNHFGAKPSGVSLTNLEGDPWLVGPSLGDVGGYRLAAGSPAASAGGAWGTQVDFFGTSRCATTPSIGIHEAQSSCLCGLANCSGICRNLSSDPYNCGRCGNRCPSTQPNCVAGQCEAVTQSPAGCSSGRKCCEIDDDGGCALCWPSGSACP